MLKIFKEIQEEHLYLRLENSATEKWIDLVLCNAQGTYLKTLLRIGPKGELFLKRNAVVGLLLGDAHGRLIVELEN